MNKEIRTAFFTALILGFTVITLYLVYIMRGIFPPIIYGGIIAYFLLPVTNFFSRKIPRSIASILTLLLFFLIFVIIGYLLFPIIIHELNELIIRLPDFYVNLSNALDSVRKLINPTGGNKYFNTIIQKFIETLQAQSSNFVEKAINSTISKISIVSSFVLSLLLSFFFMKDSKVLFRIVLRRTSVSNRKKVKFFLENTNRDLRAYFSTLLLISIFTGIVMGTASSIAGIKYAVLIGVLDSLLEMLPYIGPFVVFIVGSILSLTTSFGAFIAFVVIFALIEGLQNSVLTPHLIGGRLKITPVIVILMIAVGGSLFGALGVIIATPTFLIARNLAVFNASNRISND
ncbi:MAG: AI-2E family transporter [Caldisericaceae bacterium]